MNKTDFILITGGGGFIGSHLVDFLVDLGLINVISIDRNLQTIVARNPLCCYHQVDISNKDSMENIFKLYPIKYIFHLAGNSNVPLSNENPYIDFNSNALGTLNLYQLAKSFKVKKVVFTSTASVYGSPLFLPVNEEHPLNPVSNYALTKLYGEKLAIAYTRSYNLNSSVVRIFSSYGPRQPRYVLYDLLKKLSANSDKIELLGKPSIIRDYVFVKDVAFALYKIMILKHTNGHVFNIGGGKPITIEQLIKTICEILNINPIISFSGKSWKGDVDIFSADISKLIEYTGYIPETDLYEGLTETINWFRNNGLTLN